MLRKKGFDYSLQQCFQTVLFSMYYLPYIVEPLLILTGDKALFRTLYFMHVKRCVHVACVRQLYISRMCESCVKFSAFAKSCGSMSRRAVTRARRTHPCTPYWPCPQPRVARVVLAETSTAQRGSEPVGRVIKGEWLVGIEPSTLGDWFSGHFASSATRLPRSCTFCCWTWYDFEFYSF